MTLARKSATDPVSFDPSFAYGQLPNLTGFHLRRASLVDFGAFLDAIGDRSVTPLRYSVLEVVGANPGLQQVQLAAILGLSKPAATLAINFWQERDCLNRRETPADRRARGVHLTDTGEEVLAELRDKVALHDAALTASLSETELATLHIVLRKIIEGGARKPSTALIEKKDPAGQQSITGSANRPNDD